MELQWPLILFTTLTAWACGVFGCQGVLALAKARGGAGVGRGAAVGRGAGADAGRGAGADAGCGAAVGRGAARKSQMTLVVLSVVLLALGGIAVFFHLQHWERIFNGFGHITSGITQELIAIVVFVVIAVVYFAMLRKSGDGTVPAALAWCAIIISVVLAAVCAHSYMMPARPAWNSVLEVLSIIGGGCLMGPATCAVVMAVRGDDVAPAGVPAVACAVVGLVFTVAYAVFIQMSGSNFTNVGNYFDPNNPLKGMIDVTAIAGEQSVLLWLGAVVVGALVPLVCCIAARKKGNSASWKVLGCVAVVTAVIGAICLRVAFYNMGLSVFMFY